MKRLILIFAISFVTFSANAQLGHFYLNFDSVTVVKWLKILNIQQSASSDSIVAKRANGNLTRMHMNQLIVPWGNLTGVPTLPPSGTVTFYGGSSAPTGYLICDGSAVSRTTYSILFGIIGSTFGAGDGSTTFNIPDLRQRFPLGKAASGTGSTLGGTGGTIDHLHTVDPPSTATGAPSANVAATNLTGSAASPTHTHNVDIAVFNSGTANPPFIALNAIIKF
jgi:microcystin-dependent protein